MGNRQQHQKFTKYICTCDDEQHSPKTEQQSNKELNHYLHQSLTIFLTCDIQKLIDKLTNNSSNKLV